MSQDFFLLNRAHQINRLYGTTSDKKVVRPAEKSLARLPERTRALYQLLDEICEIASRESVGEEATLNDAQRQKLCEFEKAWFGIALPADEVVKDAPFKSFVRSTAMRNISRASSRCRSTRKSSHTTAFPQLVELAVGCDDAQGGNQSRAARRTATGLNCFVIWPSVPLPKANWVKTGSAF